MLVIDQVDGRLVAQHYPGCGSMTLLYPCANHHPSSEPQYAGILEFRPEPDGLSFGLLFLPVLERPLTLFPLTLLLVHFGLTMGQLYVRPQKEFI